MSARCFSDGSSKNWGKTSTPYTYAYAVYIRLLPVAGTFYPQVILNAAEHRSQLHHLLFALVFFLVIGFQPGWQGCTPCLVMLQVWRWWSSGRGTRTRGILTCRRCCRFLVSPGQGPDQASGTQVLQFIRGMCAILCLENPTGSKLKSMEVITIVIWVSSELWTNFENPENICGSVCGQWWLSYRASSRFLKKLRIETAFKLQLQWHLCVGVGGLNTQ